MKPMLKQVALAAALLGALGASQAATYDLGTLNTSLAQAGVVINGSFDDVFKFTAGAQTSAIGSLVGLDGGADMSFQYRFGAGAVPTWGAFSAPVAVTSDVDGNFAYFSSVSGLVAGETYWVNLKGFASEAIYSVTLAPVPEPESYALLLAGLGLVGTIAARRKTSFGA
jgi:PEP-CTERM motif